MPARRPARLDPPFAGKLAGFTLLVAGLVLVSCTQMTFAPVARLTGACGTRYAARRRTALGVPDLSQIGALAIDETAFRLRASPTDGRICGSWLDQVRGVALPFPRSS